MYTLSVNSWLIVVKFWKERWRLRNKDKIKEQWREDTWDILTVYLILPLTADNIHRTTKAYCALMNPLLSKAGARRCQGNAPRLNKHSWGFSGRSTVWMVLRAKVEKHSQTDKFRELPINLKQECCLGFKLSLTFSVSLFGRLPVDNL